MSRISKWCAVALLLAATAFGAREDRFQLQYAKDFPFHGGKVTVDHSFGSVIVDTDSGSEVHVRATIRASDPDYGKQIHVIAEEKGGGVAVRTEYPQKRFRGENSSFSVDLRVTVPAGAPVEVKNKYGSIAARGVSTSGSFVNAYGSIRLSEVKGKQHIENSFGSIDLRNVDGGIATNKYGSIHASDVDGDLTLNNGFGSVEVEGVHGNVSVTSQNATVGVRHVDGSAKIVNSFASVVAEDVKRDVDIKNQNGRVEVNNVGGNASVSNNYGSVQLDDVDGNTTVRTSFGSVFARRVRGAVDIKNQNGAIGVSALGTSCKPISLVTNFSSIRVGLPENAKYTVNARTSFGRISSALPITTRTTSEDTLIGTIGGGGCPMDLVNANGAITIEKE